MSVGSDSLGSSVVSWFRYDWSAGLDGTRWFPRDDSVMW